MERKGVGTVRNSTVTRIICVKTHSYNEEPFVPRVDIVHNGLKCEEFPQKFKNPGFLKLPRNHIPADFHFQDPPLWADWQTLSDGALCYSNVLGTQ